MMLSWLQVVLAMLTLLGSVLPRVPNSILRSKFVGCAQIVNGLLEHYKDQVITLTLLGSPHRTCRRICKKLRKAPVFEQPALVTCRLNMPRLRVA